MPGWLAPIGLVGPLLVAAYAWAIGYAANGLRALVLGLLALLTVIGMALLVHGLRLRALGRDVATSKIASAPQGYVELCGKAWPVPGQPLWSDQGWLWRRTVHARPSDLLFFRSFPFGTYKAVSWELTDRPFLLRDESGEAVVLPQGAEVICADRQTHRLNDARVMEETIRSGDDLYILGHFSSHSTPPDFDAQGERLASDWISDPQQRRRFDVNRDGYLSVEELLALRAKALATVRAGGEHENADVVNTVSRPLDGSRFVISTVSPSALSRHNGIYLWLGAALLACGTAGLTCVAASMSG